MTAATRLSLAMLLSTLAAGGAWAEASLDLATIGGDWQGAGSYARGTDEPGRIRCKISISDTARGTTLVEGRCATAEGSDVFGLEVSEGENGQISAQNRMDPPGNLPVLLEGTLADGILVLQGEGIAALEMRLEDDALTLAIVSGAEARPGRMDVRLTRAAP
ncbi:hypothetical protein [Phaeovulum sp.]|uniref:hypothetical protein n=1 Tax=Phaeovulum sp. TaxID=2934796 RepID=UPI0035650A27